MQRVTIEPKVTDQKCPTCGSPLVLRDGRYGEFLACQSTDCPTRIFLDKRGQPKKEARPSGVTCEQCGAEMVIRTNRRGEEFLGCSGYPKCRNTKPMETLSAASERSSRSDQSDQSDQSDRSDRSDKDKGQRTGDESAPRKSPITGEEALSCPRCGQPMARKSSYRGDFWGCTGYPECRYTKPISVDLEIPCPVGGCDGTLVQKSSRKGKFYGCNRYPQCQFATWLQPLKQTCPQCGAALGRDLRREDRIACLREGCGYTSDGQTIR